MNKCEVCVYWRDFYKRVWARISEFDTNRAGNILELRVCNFIPAPSINNDRGIIYTDKDYVCGNFKFKEEPK